MPRAGPNSAGSDSDLHDCLVPHARKEDMAMLPMLDNLMDADKETQLYEKYVENI